MKRLYTTKSGTYKVWSEEEDLILEEMVEAKRNAREMIAQIKQLELDVKEAKQHAEDLRQQLIAGGRTEQGIKRRAYVTAVIIENADKE